MGNTGRSQKMRKGTEGREIEMMLEIILFMEKMRMKIFKRSLNESNEPKF